MVQALITVNGVAGSNTDLPIATLVQLNNTNNGGELTYAWSILDQPAGAADALSASNIQNPTFTPNKEGTYLIQLVVNASLASQQTNLVVCSVRQLKTRLRVPAAGESTQADLVRGWATSVNIIEQAVDRVCADPGLLVAQSNAALSAGNVVSLKGSAVIKSGLPGQETVPIASLADPSATDGASPMGVIVGAVDGGAIANGTLIIVRVDGILPAASLNAAVLGNAVFVNNSGALSLTPGTNVRRIGTVTRVPSGTTADIFVQQWPGYAPGEAWLHATGVAAVDASHGVTGIADDGTGGCVVTFRDAAPAAAQQCVTASADGSTATTAIMVSVFGLTTTQATVRGWVWNGAAIVQQTLVGKAWSLRRSCATLV